MKIVFHLLFIVESLFDMLKSVKTLRNWMLLLLSFLGAASLAPTRMELTYTKRITQRNPYVQRIVAKMFPSYSLQNVLFLGDDVAVSVDPAGVVTPLKIGTSRIHVIPTQATHLYKTINVTVQAPSVRLTGGGKIRVDSKGRIRLT